MGAEEPLEALVTGGSGFLGGWCLVELLNRGHRVRTTVRKLSCEPGVRHSIAAEIGPDAQQRLEFRAADLTADEGWEEATAGCDAVLHVASPFPSAQPKDPDELIVPAREGTLRVLRAALGAGARRVVVTSSVAAVGGGADPADSPLDESSWTETGAAGVTPYAQSKTLAERAAWDLARERDALDRVAFVNPGAILGPALSDDHSFSLEVVTRLLSGMPGVPRIGFSIVDVRDVAALQVMAMTDPAASGERFIAVSRFAWMEEVARTLREGLGPDAEKVPTRRVPDLMVRAMGLFDPGVRSIVGQLGKELTYSSEKARTRLGWSPRPVEETVLDCGRSLA
jgi:nucleoside-diphosphate-sugar epimerase